MSHQSAALPIAYVMLRILIVLNWLMAVAILSSKGAAGVTGIVLTKLDGTAKGGVAVAIAHDLKLPIRYVGVGEGIDDLIPFSPRDYVQAIFQQKW